MLEEYFAVAYNLHFIYTYIKCEGWTALREVTPFSLLCTTWGKTWGKGRKGEELKINIKAAEECDLNRASA